MFASQLSGWCPSAITPPDIRATLQEAQPTASEEAEEEVNAEQQIKDVEEALAEPRDETQDKAVAGAILRHMNVDTLRPP